MTRVDTTLGPHPKCGPMAFSPLRHLLPAALLLASTLAIAPAAHAADPLAQADLRLGTVRGDGWQASGVRVRVALDARLKPSLVFTADRIQLPAGLGLARGVTVRCPRLVTGPGTYACAEAAVAGDLGVLGRQSLTAAFSYDETQGTVTFETASLRLADSPSTISARLAPSGWTLDIRAPDTEAAALKAVLAPFVSLPEGSWAGRLGVDARVEGRESAVSTVRAGVTIKSLAYSSPDGLLASDALAGQLDIVLHPGPASTALEMTFAGTGGQAYVDPVFMDVGKSPFTLRLAGQLREADSVLTAATLRFEQPGHVSVHGTGELDFGAGKLARALTLQLDRVDFPAAWGVYAAPFLATTDFKNLTATGAVHGTVEVRDGLPARLDLRLDDVTLDEPGGALGLTSLAGELRWAGAEAPESADANAATESRLHFAGGRLYGIPFGAAQLRLLAEDRGVRLLEGTTIPVFNGGLRVDTFRVRHAGQPNMWLRLDAEVLPINLADICRTLGWPEFGGTLAGRIPKAALDEGVLTLGGNLEATAFDGKVTVRNLRLQDALGRFPQFQADVDLENLDLQLVTEAFEFGRITGRMSGYFHELQLFNWVPVAFDAKLGTPPGYKGKRRITPRAVENLSNIGGGSGITSALSGGFLSVFKEFRYQKLGLACHLERDVCLMSGVAPAPGGYYLIQGAGFPRVNLIGSQGRVTWSKLLKQLQRISEGAPLSVN